MAEEAALAKFKEATQYIPSGRPTIRTLPRELDQNWTFTDLNTSGGSNLTVYNAPPNAMTFSGGNLMSLMATGSSKLNQ